MSQDPVERLSRSWEANASAWTAAVRSGSISSRRLATDEAILSAVVERAPRRVLDLGCGEGWLARALAQRGIEVVGVDASAPLIEQARDAGAATFHVVSYAELIGGTPVPDGVFDAVVCNFALLEADLAPLLRTLRGQLAPGGTLLIQTVHPWAAKGAESYQDGWRVERFSGFGEAFAEPMPWYFRTLESWIRLLRASGYRLGDLREPRHPETQEPLSLLLTASPAP